MVYDPKADLYVRLGVPHTATAAEIRTAYRARIKRAHPDRSTGSTTKAAALNVAYDVLGDPDKRAAYDEERRLHAARTAAAKAAARRPKKARARAAAVVSKGARKVRGVPRSTAPSPSPPSPPSPSATDVVVENVVEHLRRGQYGRALGWFALGLFAAPAASPAPPAALRTSSSQRRRR